MERGAGRVSSNERDGGKVNVELCELTVSGDEGDSVVSLRPIEMTKIHKVSSGPQRIPLMGTASPAECDEGDRPRGEG